MKLTFREYLEAFCYVSQEKLTAEFAFTFLKEGIGERVTNEILPGGKTDDKLKSYIRPERNLSKNKAKSIKEEYTNKINAKMHREDLRDYFTDHCLNGEERILRTQEAFSKYCPQLPSKAHAKSAKKSILDSLEDLFITMLDLAIEGYRSKETEQRVTNDSEAYIVRIANALVEIKNTIQSLEGELLVLDLTFPYNNPINSVNPFELYCGTTLNQTKIETLQHPLYAPSEDAFNKFSNLNSQLETYCDLYPTMDKLKELFSAGKQLKYSDFCQVKNGLPQMYLSDAANKYKELLDSLISEFGSTNKHKK